MNNLNQETTPGARNREMPGQSGNDGEGPPPEWGRSDFEAGTFPSDSALQGALGPFQWGRHPAKKQTFPKTPGDLPHFAGSPATPCVITREGAGGAWPGAMQWVFPRHGARGWLRAPIEGRESPALSLAFRHIWVPSAHV